MTCVPVGFGVLGPVVAWSETGAPVDLRGPRHRAVLGRLLVARGRVVPVDRMVDDLWTDPPGQRWEDFRHATDDLVTVLEGQMSSRSPARFAASGLARNC